MTLRGTFRDGVIIPEQSDGLRNGDMVDIVRRRSAKVGRGTKGGRGSISRRMTAKQRLESFMSAFGGLKGKAEWKGRSSAEIARELRERAVRRSGRG